MLFPSINTSIRGNAPPDFNQVGGCYDTAKRRVKLSKKYKQMIPLYRHFGRHWEHCMDFSEDALLDLYIYESTGQGQVKSDNGYANGKKWMDVAVAQWREDLWRILFPWELYDDPDLPDWWLDKVLGIKVVLRP